MKLTAYFLSLVSALLLLIVALPASACGPYPPIIPTPDYFRLPADKVKSSTDYDREENLLLWQALTSDRIPLKDIEQAVYKDSREKFDAHTGYWPRTTDNLFYIYINNTGDEEIIDFLYTAKSLEERRRKMNSSWYYPRKKEWSEEHTDFDDIIESCREYRGTRLRDRYALQLTRALFASHRYAECVEYVDSAFAAFPDTNLFKRMAQEYAEGSLIRLKENGLDSILDDAGDFDSRVEAMAAVNPDSPRLIDYIRANADNTVGMLRIVQVLRSLIKNPKALYKGDWLFALAFIGYECECRPEEARAHIYQAMRQRFSSENLRDLAWAYKMKLDAVAGYTGSLVDDLRWIEGKADPLQADAGEWVRRCRNIIYENWIPGLWRSRDYTTAILLCGYADAFDCAEIIHAADKHNMSESEGYINSHDYGSLSFQMMQSLSSSQLAAVYAGVRVSSPLKDFLRRLAPVDSDYFNELIGTLALREENYAKAVQYLSLVSDDYNSSLNINTGGYLACDPFILSYIHRSGYTLSYKDGEWLPAYHYAVAPSPYNNAKLDFARRMLELEQMKKHGRTADDRGLARLMYAVGRMNSFESCWALTQYWRGWVGLFEPSLQYWEGSFCEHNYGFLYDYEYSGREEETHNIFRQETNAALSMLTTDDARAKAQYLLGNLRTIKRRYPGTPVAQRLATSCDNWHSWL